MCCWQLELLQVAALHLGGLARNRYPEMLYFHLKMHLASWICPDPLEELSATLGPLGGFKG